MIPGIDIQGGVSVSDIVQQQEMGGDRGDVQGPVEVPPPGGAMYHGAVGETWGRQRVGVTLGGGVNGSCGAPPNRGIHHEAAGDHSGECGLPPHL